MHGQLGSETQWARHDDCPSRDELVRRNFGFVVTVAKEYRRVGLPLEDLIGEGIVGLIQAVRRFDSSKGVKFLTYARWWIRKEILRSISEQTAIVSVPDHRRRQLRDVSSDRNRYAQELGREPSWEELCRISERDPEEVVRILQAELTEIRLDHPSGSGEWSPMLERLSDSRLQGADELLIRQQLCSRVQHAMRRLPERHRRVLTARFGLDGHQSRTLREVGTQEGISRERTRQIETEAIERLRRSLTRRPAAAPPTSFPTRSRYRMPAPASVASTLSTGSTTV